MEALRSSIEALKASIALVFDLKASIVSVVSTFVALELIAATIAFVFAFMAFTTILVLEFIASVREVRADSKPFCTLFDRLGESNWVVVFDRNTSVEVGVGMSGNRWSDGFN